MNHRGQSRIWRHGVVEQAIVEHVLEPVTLTRNHAPVRALEIDRTFMIATDAEAALVQ